METHSSFSMAMTLPNYQLLEHEDIFTVTPSDDFSETSGVCEISEWGFFEGMDMADLLWSDDALYQPQHCHIPQLLSSGLDEQLMLESSEKGVDDESPCGENSLYGRKRCRVVDGSRVSRLSKETISNYFYLPIAKAAEELKVGVTYLKKRCRELGIKRWPHRKLMSLQTLIKNVQELGKESGERMGEECIQVLEQEKKLMESIPDLRLEEKTKRLRQACFKANYKKRKLMGVVVSSPPVPASCKEVTSFVNESFGNLHGSSSAEVDDEEIKCLIEDFCTSVSSDMKLLEY